MNATIIGLLLSRGLTFLGGKAQTSPRLTSWIGLATGGLGLFGVAPSVVKTTLLTLADTLRTIATLIP
jgi:hypothetical protein